MILGFTFIRFNNSSFLSGRLLQFHWMILSDSVLFRFPSVVIFTLFEWVPLDSFSQRSSLFTSRFSGIWLSLIATSFAPQCPLVSPTSLKHSIFLAAIDGLFPLHDSLPRWSSVRPCFYVYFNVFFAVIVFLDDLEQFCHFCAVSLLFWIVSLTCFFAVFSCSGFRLLWSHLALFFINNLNCSSYLFVVFAGASTWYELFPILISFTLFLPSPRNSVFSDSDLLLWGYSAFTYCYFHCSLSSNPWLISLLAGLLRRVFCLYLLYSLFFFLEVFRALRPTDWNTLVS